MGVLSDGERSSSTFGVHQATVIVAITVFYKLVVAVVFVVNTGQSYPFGLPVESLEKGAGMRLLALGW